MTPGLKGKYSSDNLHESVLESLNVTQPLREKCPYSELFWSECGKMRTRITRKTDSFYAVTELRKK